LRLEWRGILARAREKLTLQAARDLSPGRGHVGRAVPRVRRVASDNPGQQLFLIRPAKPPWS